MLARLLALMAKPCAEPWYFLPANFEGIERTQGHMTPFPNAKKTAATYQEEISGGYEDELKAKDETACDDQNRLPIIFGKPCKNRALYKSHKGTDNGEINTKFGRIPF